MKKTILSILFTLCIAKLFGQYIIAGSHVASDCYFNIIPDRVVHAPTVTFPSFNKDSAFFDLNGDNLNDFMFVATSDNGGNWYNYVNCAIVPLNGSQVAISGFHSCFANCPSTSLLYQLPIARLYSSGDLILNSHTWIDSIAYLSFERWAANTPNNCGYSCNGKVMGNSGFLGVRVVSPIDTVYGWIHVDSVATNSITIKEYSCSKSSSSVFDIASNYSVEVYPNPFSTQTFLRFSRPLRNSTLKLYSLSGQQLMQVININGETLSIARNDLDAGMYFLQIIQDSQTIIFDKLVIFD